ncbi:MAG: A/G-specific adenine glycosylase [Alphaproteobacteria bacterium]|nr:A/G-specific adenine glycosylase [Alphaproteobacteria bacterium]
MTVAATEPPAAAELAGLLLAWYDRHRRRLPWRAPPGARADPYHVWLSEIMLQQTTVAAVAPYFQAFLERWPKVHDLAEAPVDDVLHAWQGLGYYARARNLHRCAQVIVSEHGGRFPADETVLLGLPGVGRYTAAAIAAIAFDRRAVVVDGNVERVMARMFAVEDPLPGAKSVLHAHAAALTPARRPGDYAQAVMDLGATLCAPRAPKCGLCPWESSCLARSAGIAGTLPRKAPKAERPTRKGVAFFLTRRDGAILLRRRPASGLLGGMMEVPSTEWRVTPWEPADAHPFAPAAADWRLLSGIVRHTFTHFHLELAVMAGRAEDDIPTGIWCPPDRLGEQALPTVMKKVLRHAMRKTA